jgi:CheY-like chemotaxis protein
LVEYNVTIKEYKTYSLFNYCQVMDPFFFDTMYNTVTILVVDDIPDNCFLLQVLLEAEGYSVDIAGSGFEAIAKIELNLPSLVLLDIMMPGMNGFEVVENIRENLHLLNLPILFVTGMDASKNSEVEQANVNGVIRKPIDLEQLLEKVKAFA